MKRTALVTGGTRGIGYAICKQLAVDGFDIAVMDLAPAEVAAENLQKIREEYSCEVLYAQGSIAEAADRERCIDQIIDRYGRIDVLVNNAGVAPKVRADLLDMTEESYDFVMGINVRGALFLTQLAAKKMLETLKGESGTIVFISSMSAYVSSVSRGEYCISKAGVSMLTRLFADRMADSGIRVYEVRPGIISTDMTKVVTAKYDALFEQGICPIARWGKPEDVAGAVGVLCSGKLPYSTGDIINVDGGYHVQRL